MDFPGRREVHFPRNASLEADAPWNATGFLGPQHPQSAPSSHPQPVPGQPYGHADVQDAMVSVIGIVIFPINEDAYARAVSSSRQLLVIIGQTKTGRICPHPSKTMLRKVNHRTFSTSTWEMITLAIMLSTTMLGLLWISPHRPPHQPPCVLISPPHTHI